MFGWEFPPHVSGGLGTACFGVTKALAGIGHMITFVIPKMLGESGPLHVELISAANIPVHRKRFHETVKIFKGLDIRLINSTLRPYVNTSQYDDSMRKKTIHKSAYKTARSVKEDFRLLETSGHYGNDLFAEVVRYGHAAGAIAKSQSFDIIHAHDWMTVFAGLYAREISGKPFILHIHSLEYDRSGENINKEIFYVERFGLVLADHIIAVSNYTKNMIVKYYGIHPDKISVVHNAVSRADAPAVYRSEPHPDRKIVLFLGRITFQKGPDYFVEAAAKVLKKIPETTFVMAGSGDMMTRMIKRAAELGIGKNFHFTGFLQGAEVERIFTMSDLYVMPSVSEPFGISPLEAMLYDVPVIISRQSGVSEILHHALKVDFWDVNEIADKIIAILRHPHLIGEIVERSREELRKIRWEKAAEKIVAVYNSVLH
jgi:glycosyltransferase involved in cell wall biosynthesis